MYVHLMTCFPSMSWEYIDERMTLPRYRAIYRYQKAHPPLHIMVAAFFGLNKTDEAAPKELDADGKSLFDMMPQGPKFTPDKGNA